MGVFKGSGVADRSGSAFDSASRLLGRLNFGVGASGFVRLELARAAGSNDSPAERVWRSAEGEASAGGVVRDKAEQQSKASVDRIKEPTSVLQALGRTG